MAVGSLATSIAQLGWSLIRQECTTNLPQAGIIISPLSITIALGMLAGGAEGDHRENFCKRLGIANSNDLGPTFQQLITFLHKSTDGEGVSLANALFTDQSYAVHANYTQFLQSFTAVTASLPSLSAATNDINEWIASQTKGMITNLLKPSMLDQTQMLILNALAFKGVWENRFDPKDTVSNHPFRKESDKGSVEMMFRYSAETSVCHKTQYTAVKLPYRATSIMLFASAPSSPQMCLIAFLPHENVSLQSVLLQIEQDTTSLAFNSITLTKLGLPKFNVRSDMDIASILQKLGYPISGDYSAMGSGGNMNMVQSIVHSAIIKVDEEGTVAAAVTRVLTFGSAPRPSESIIFDRPFAFAIVEQQFNMVIFSGLFCG